MGTFRKQELIEEPKKKSFNAKHLFVSRAHCRGEDVAQWVQPLGNLLDERAEIVSVILGVGTLEEPGVLPVKVETLEAKLLHEGDDGVNEDGAPSRISGHLGKLLRSSSPAA